MGREPNRERRPEMVSKETATQVAQEMKTAMEEILKRHNLDTQQVKWGHGDWFEWKITATAIELGPNGVNLATPEAQYYTKFGFSAYGQAPNFTQTELTAPLGTEIQVQGQTLYFAGIAPKKRKFPIAVINASGEMMFLTEASVATLNKNAQVNA